MITILDIINSANMILYDYFNELGDVNQDNKTKILDIMSVVGIILGS